MRFLIIIMIFCFTASCIKNSTVHMDDFKKGRFKTLLDDNDVVSFATRNDSIQIEEFNGVMDTFRINWLDQFEYELLKKNPKTLLDSTPFYVKIISVKENSYQFQANYKGSNFKQKGTATKVVD